MRSRRERACGRPRWLEVLAMAAKYFGRRRQAMMAKIACETKGRLLKACAALSADLRRSHNAAITRSRSTAADHKAPLALVMSGFLGMAGHPEMQSTY